MHFLSFVNSKKFIIPIKNLFHNNRRIPMCLNLNMEEFGFSNILDSCPDVKNYIQMVSNDYCFSITRELRKEELTYVVEIYALPETLKKKKTSMQFKDLKCMDVFETPDHEIHIKIGDAPNEFGYMGMNGVLLQEFLPLVEGYPVRRDKNGNVIHYTQKEILELPVQLLYNIAKVEY